MSMNLPLKPELERFVDDEVRSGHYSSAAAVIEAGLARLMLDPPPDEIDADTLAAIEEARVQCDRGEGIELNEACDQLRRKHFGKR